MHMNLKSNYTFIQKVNTENCTNVKEYTSQFYEKLKILNVNSYQNVNKIMYYNTYPNEMFLC